MSEPTEQVEDVEDAPKAKKKSKPVHNEHKHPDGHALVDGARWHYPKTGSPSECAIPGCDRVLTRHLKKDAVEEMEALPEAPEGAS